MEQKPEYLKLTPEYEADRLTLSNLIDNKKSFDKIYNALLSLSDKIGVNPNNSENFEKRILPYVRLTVPEIYKIYKESLVEEAA